jgi:hypothetical protein
LETIKTNYDLDEFVSDRLVMGFHSFGQDGKKKWKGLATTTVVDEVGMRTNSVGEQVEVSMNDLELAVQQSAGDEVDEDCSCDSTFMLEKAPRIGSALRAAFHWLNDDETIYLFMDNAGGHGTHEAIAQYTDMLWNQFRVEIVWQVPRSPETNMLDLGVWMSVQAAVTRAHHMRRCHHDALARSVEDAWNSYLSPDAFKNVHRRLRVVLSCIEEDKGGNSLVEQKRGKLFRDATLIDLTEDDDDNATNVFTVDDFDEIDDLADDIDLNI